MGFGSPGKRAIILQRGIGFAQQNIAVIGSAEERIAHVRGDIPDRKIEWDFPVSPNDLTAAHFETVDGEREKLLHRFRVRNLLHFWFGLVGAAVGIKNDVNDGMIKNQVTQSDFRPPNRPDLDLGHQTIQMGVRHFPGLLSAVDGQIAHFHLKVKRDGVEATQYHPSAGHLFQHGHQTLANQIAKRIGGTVPAQAHQQQQCAEHEP